MAKKKKEKAVKAIEKAGRKAVGKGVTTKAAERALKKGMAAGGKKEPKKSASDSST